MGRTESMSRTERGGAGFVHITYFWIEVIMALPNPKAQTLFPGDGTVLGTETGSGVVVSVKNCCPMFRATCSAELWYHTQPRLCRLRETVQTLMYIEEKLSTVLKYLYSEVVLSKVIVSTALAWTRNRQVVEKKWR